MTSTSVILAAGTPADAWPGMGVAGTVVFLALCVATFFLWRSMNHQLTKVRLPTEEELAQAEVDAGTAAPATAAKLAARTARRAMVGPNAKPSKSGAPIAGSPGTSEPRTSEPATSEPGTSEPGTSEPRTSEPATSEPGTSHPAGDASGRGVDPGTADDTGRRGGTA